MRIRVLIENTTDSDLVCEHGLSLLIEYKEKKYLLDAGSTGIFLENAERLQEPVDEADVCILSHGHYDHAGGFAEYLKRNSGAKVYAMREAVGDYHSASGGELHYIGIPEEVYPAFAPQFVLLDGMQKLAEDVYLIPHSTKGLETIGARTKLYRRVAGEYLPDNFAHELSLVFDTEDGLVICNSCSHAGIRTIINEVRAVLPGRPLNAFIGGLHMKGTRNGEEYCTFTEEEIKEIAGYLEAEGLRCLYTGHCTGAVGFELLQKYRSSGLETLTTGREIFI